MGPFATEWIPEIRVRGYSEHSAQVLSRQGRLCGHKRSPRPVHGLSYSITSSRSLNEIGCEAAGNGVSHRTAWWPTHSRFLPTRALEKPAVSGHFRRQ